MPKFKHVAIVSEGIRGHYHQSLGIANWIERLGEAKQYPVIEVPKFSGLKKLRMKFSVKKLVSGDSEYAKKWLAQNGFHELNFDSETLFISAGSSAAPFCLALAKATKNKSAVIMTPSVLGTKPFDFAIVPEHDKHDNDKNIITTLGAPNHIYGPELKNVAAKFFMDKNFSGRKVIALLIGGSDANYKITPQWAKESLEPFKNIKNAALLITTSRRTGKEVDEVIGEIFADYPSLEYLLLMSKDSSANALTAMLGAATHVFVTEDSVSMVSEEATAGFNVGLIRVPHFKTVPMKNLIGYGTKRFDEMFNRMILNGLITDITNQDVFEKFIATNEQRNHKNFNEAKRVAEWILNQ